MPRHGMALALLFAALCALCEDLPVSGYTSCTGISKEAGGGRRLLDLTTEPACSTNRALGYAVGKHFRDNIVARVAAAGAQLQRAVAYAQTEDGRAARDSLVNASRAHYPQYWEELEGIAEGSGLPLDLIVALNLRLELSTLAEGGAGTAGADDCSDSMLELRENGRTTLALLGHNEDGGVDAVNTSYFVQARLNGRSWTAYTYAGELSTSAWGFNDAGVSFTLDAVYARRVRPDGLARNWVSRSLLDAASLDDAVAAATVAGQAAGHNVNLIGLDETRIVSIETGPGTASDVREVRGGSYFHANAFLRLEAPRSREDILRLLGDTQDAEFPIWRSGREGVFTLCTALFDLEAETVEIFFANPKDSLTAARPWTLPLRSAAVA